MCVCDLKENEPENTLIYVDFLCVDAVNEEGAMEIEKIKFSWVIHWKSSVFFFYDIINVIVYLIRVNLLG